MNNRFHIATVIAVIGLAVSNPVFSQRAPVPVVVAKARTMPARHVVRLPGTVVAMRSAQLSSAIGGMVRTVHLDFGDRVKSGQIVVELDDKLAQLQLAQAQAAVQEAVFDAKEKQRLLRVGRNLTRRGVVTKDQLDTRLAEAQVAQAVVKKLRAAEDGQRELLNRHRIVAPFAGIIAHKFVESGEWVSPGTSIVHLIADRDVVVDVSLPQNYYSRLNGQTEYSLSFDAIPGKSVIGRRVAISPVSDSTMRTFKLRIGLSKSDPTIESDGLMHIAPGMSAQVKLTLRDVSTSVVIPRDAVVRQADGRTTVWVVDSTVGKERAGIVSDVAERTIRISESFDDDVTVISGLTRNDWVVVDGNESLRPNQKVRIARAAQ